MSRDIERRLKIASRLSEIKAGFSGIEDHSRAGARAREREREREKAR
jgi:hypothetical protein